MDREKNIEVSNGVEEAQTSLPTAPLDARIEALLFAHGGSLKFAALARMLGASTAEVEQALQELRIRLTGGIVLIEQDAAYSLATAPVVADILASVRKKDWEGELGQAGLEVIAIILHRKETTRSSIDYIRGVNSASTLRILQTKGLIERASNKDAMHGEPLYRATPALLAHLGVTHVSDIPNHAATLAELEKFESRDTGTSNETIILSDDDDEPLQEDDEPTA